MKREGESDPDGVISDIPDDERDEHYPLDIPDLREKESGNGYQ